LPHKGSPCVARSAGFQPPARLNGGYRTSLPVSPGLHGITFGRRYRIHCVVDFDCDLWQKSGDESGEEGLIASVGKNKQHRHDKQCGCDEIEDKPAIGGMFVDLDE